MITIDRKTVMEKYDEIGRLETLGDRREFLLKQSKEMKAALWLENTDQKTKRMEIFPTCLFFPSSFHFILSSPEFHSFPPFFHFK